VEQQFWPALERVRQRHTAAKENAYVRHVPYHHVFWRLHLTAGPRIHSMKILSDCDLEQISPSGYGCRTCQSTANL
jgi:hypothetical protein